ncbi:hypothetical protein TWF694_001674 [Orbilia ellipsospora]|uniref:Uncharacterized protein n=1 Tax=Orbilia ellipsospora TaxID=2528407 RepID=A0AAV9X3K1_9PEZI
MAMCICMQLLRMPVRKGYHGDYKERTRGPDKGPERKLQPVSSAITVWGFRRANINDDGFSVTNEARKEVKRNNSCLLHHEQPPLNTPLHAAAVQLIAFK